MALKLYGNHRSHENTHKHGYLKRVRRAHRVPYPDSLRESPSTDPDTRDLFKAFVVAKLPSVSVLLRSARLSVPLLVGCALLHSVPFYNGSARCRIGQDPFGSSWSTAVHPAVILVAFCGSPDEPSGADNLLFVSPTCAKGCASFCS